MLILDIRLPSKSGLEFQTELTGLAISLPIAFLTGHMDVAMGGAGDEGRRV